MAYDAVAEEVPGFRKRAGDMALAGTNNTLLVLGTDRPGDADSGHGGGPGAGTIHIVVGRAGEDPSMEGDRAYVYVSMKTDADRHAGTEGIGDDRAAASAVLVKADSIRIVAREDLKVRVGRAYLRMSADGTIVVEGDVQLGEGATERILRGDRFARHHDGHVHPTPSGLSGAPTQPTPDDAFSPRSRVA